jgi:hypothetical protein
MKWEHNLHVTVFRFIWRDKKAAQDRWYTKCIHLLEAEEHNLLPTTLMGARPGRSTVTALEMLTEQIQTHGRTTPL